MTKYKVHKNLSIVGYHARILLFGIRNMLVGTLTLLLFATAIFGFHLVSEGGGYLAVLDFIMSCVALIVAVCSVYLLGFPRKRRGGRYVER